MTFSIAKLYVGGATSSTSTERISILRTKPWARLIFKATSTNSSILNSSSVISSLSFECKSRLTSHHYPIATLKSEHRVLMILLTFYSSPFHQLGQNQHSMLLVIYVPSSKILTICASNSLHTS
jgi:hypothetical protein